MSIFSAEEIGDILYTAQIGLWRLEGENGVFTKMHTDAFMDELMGIESDVSPEEKLAFLEMNVHPDDRKMFEEYSNKLYEQEQAEVVYRYEHPKKGLLYVRCGGKQSKIEGDKRIIEGYHQNITESVRVEKAYEKRNTQMLAALGADYEAVHIVDLDYNTIETLRASYIIEEIGFEAGYNAYDEVMEAMIHRFVLKEEQKEFLDFVDRDAMIKRLELENEFYYRYQIVPDSTNNRVYEMHFVNIARKKERHVIVIGTRCIDKIVIKERENSQYSEALLNDSVFFYEFDVTEGYIKQAFHITKEYNPFYDLDIKLPIYYDYFNFYKCKELGMRAYTEKEDRYWTCEGLKEAYANGKRSVEIRYDSEELKLSWTATVIMTEDRVDNHLHAVYICRDVTELRQSELLRQKELETALREAQRANNAKSTFLSRMSHDIRTPLNGIIGLLEIGEKHKDEYELINANRKKAIIAANHLLSLVNDVLDMSKLQDENTELLSESFDLQDLCRDILTIGNLRAKENGIQLTHDNGGNIKYNRLIGSPLHVKQILLNLVNNSVKYNKQNGSIRCATEMVSSDAESVVYKFTVEDTGIGMSAEYLEHLYEPFTQERNDARSRYQGTGMGMAIVKTLVDKMNGSIEVKSEVGVGTRFDVILPFIIDSSYNEQKSELVKEDADITGMNILLVEDNELNMEIAEYVLEDAGANVAKAENGLEAYNLFLEKPAGSFDAILMDIMMPELDGYEATIKIRNTSKADSGTIPIIAMTANAFAEDVQHAKSVGMNDHLAKPLDVDKLVSVLAQYKK